MEKPSIEELSSRAYSVLCQRGEDFFSQADELRSSISQPEDLLQEKYKNVIQEMYDSVRKVVELSYSLHKLKETDLPNLAGHGLRNFLGGADSTLYFLLNKPSIDREWLEQKDMGLWASVLMTKSLIKLLAYWYDRSSFAVQTLSVGDIFNEILLYELNSKVAVPINISPEVQSQKVVVHPWTVNSLLYNICRNAETWLATEILIDVQKKEPNIEIQIADNGPGIDEKSAPHIFEQGFSGRKSTGLGLALADERMAAMGGKIGFECHGGLPTLEKLRKFEGQKGAKFILTLSRQVSDKGY